LRFVKLPARADSRPPDAAPKLQPSAPKSIHPWLLSVLAAAITAIFVAFLAASLFDVAYYDYKILLLFWLLAGLAASLPRLFGAMPLD
jgi:hypothetical protein